MDDTSYYDILGLKKDFTDEDLKQAWKKACRDYHPDKLPADKKSWGEKKFKEAKEAHTVLKDPQKRHNYDMHGKAGVDGMDNMNDMEAEEERIFEIINADKDRVEPIHAFCEITLEDAFIGKTVEIDVERFSLCTDCAGTGSSDKKKYQCVMCLGKGQVRGVVQIAPGMVQQTMQLCRRCNGSGRDTSKIIKCEKCNTRGANKESTKIKVAIDKGIADGDNIDIKDKGNEIPKDIKSQYRRGRIILTVKVKEHPVFKRSPMINGLVNPANLMTEVKLTLAEAICGFSKKITHLDGRELIIDNDQIVSDGDIKMIEHEGISFRGKYYKKGHLFVKFVVSPAKLTSEIRSKIYKSLTNKTYDHQKVHPHSKASQVSKLVPIPNAPVDDHDIDTDHEFNRPPQSSCNQQ